MPKDPQSFNPGACRLLASPRFLTILIAGGIPVLAWPCGIIMQIMTFGQQWDSEAPWRSATGMAAVWMFTFYPFAWVISLKIAHVAHQSQNRHLWRLSIVLTSVYLIVMVSLVVVNMALNDALVRSSGATIIP